MMSPETIIAENRKAARKASRAKKQPYVIYDMEDIDTMHFPHFGNYCPKGWLLIDQWMCDSSGFGSESEPALTMNQLRAKLIANLDKNYGYATISAGQFQVYLGVFEKIEKKDKK